MCLWIFVSIDSAERQFYRQIKNCMCSSFYLSVKFLFPYGSIDIESIETSPKPSWTHMASTPHMICQNDPCKKPSVYMTFLNSYHEQHWHEFPKHLQSPYLETHMASTEPYI